MKTNPDFILRNIAGDNILVPCGHSAKAFNALINLNDTAAFIWKELDSSKDTNDLVQKVIGANERSIQLPIQLNFLKDYCISYLISPKNMDQVITWIILRHATTYYCLTNPKKN